MWDRWESVTCEGLRMVDWLVTHSWFTDSVGYRVLRWVTVLVGQLAEWVESWLNSQVKKRQAQPPTPPGASGQEVEHSQRHSKRKWHALRPNMAETPRLVLQKHPENLLYLSRICLEHRESEKSAPIAILTTLTFAPKTTHNAPCISWRSNGMGTDNSATKPLRKRS